MRVRRKIKSTAICPLTSEYRVENISIWSQCGMIVAYNDSSLKKMHTNSDMTVHLCNTCGNMTEFSRVEIPYAYKLLSQELQTINIVPRIITE